MVRQVWLMIEADPVRQIHIGPGYDAPVRAAAGGTAAAGQAQVR
jgi:hypothetical protein